MEGYKRKGHANQGFDEEIVTEFKTISKIRLQCFSLYDHFKDNFIEASLVGSSVQEHLGELMKKPLTR